MTVRTLAEIAAPLLSGVVLAVPLGAHLARVWAGETTALEPALGPVERMFYRALRIDPQRRQDWAAYALSLLLLNGAAFVLLYVALRLLGGAGGHPLSPDATFRFAWAGLAEAGADGRGLVGLAVGGGSGLAAAGALARSLARPRASQIGNAWSDVIRADLYVLLPIGMLTMLGLSTGGDADARTFIVALGRDTVGFACAFAFGRMVRDRTEGGILAFAMGVITGLLAWLQASAAADPAVSASAGDRAALFSGLVLETLEGGIGPGFASLLIVALLAVCLGGLLVGRTPEYLGKRLGAREVKLVVFASLGLWAAILGLAAAAALLSKPLASGLGGAWAGGYGAAFGNVAAALLLALGRFGVLIPTLAIAGALSAKPRRGATAGTTQTGNILFVGLLTAAALGLTVAWLTPALVRAGAAQPASSGAVGERTR